MAQRRVFTKEFKEEAVALIRTSGRSVTDIVNNLGINVNMLCRWKREAERAVFDSNIKAFSGKGNARDEMENRTQSLPRIFSAGCSPLRRKLFRTRGFSLMTRSRQTHEKDFIFIHAFIVSKPLKTLTTSAKCGIVSL
jgi:transposase